MVAGAGAADSAATQTRTITAASIQVDAETEQGYLENMQELADQYGLETKDNAFLLTNGDKEWLVFTDQEPKIGEATVKGTVALRTTSSQWGAIFANSVSFSQDGERVSASEVRNNPEEYDGELVKTIGAYRQLPFATEAGHIVKQTTTAGLGGGRLALSEQPGGAARWNIRELSASDDQWVTGWQRVGAGGEALTTIGWGESRWQIDAQTTVDAVVLASGNGPSLVVADTEVESQQLDSVSEIATRGDELEGQVVTVTSQTAGAKISAQETLLSVAQCAPESVVFPPTGCIPVPVDSMVHAGVLFDGVPQSFDDVVVYAGVSSHHQDRVVTPEHGTYRVTGRVVSTDKIDPSLPDGYALVVYDMERTDDLQAKQEVQNEAEGYAEKVEVQMRKHINGSASESTATATATPGEGSSGGSGDDADASKSTATGPADIQIEDVKVAASEIEVGQSVAVVVTVENHGGNQGSRTLYFSVDGREIDNQDIILGPGESETIRFGVSLDEAGKYDIAVSGKSAGTLQAMGEGNSNSVLDGPVLGGFAKMLLGGLLLVGGVVAFVSSILFDMLRSFKKWRQGSVETSEKPAELLMASSPVLLLVGGFLSSGKIGELGMVVGFSLGSLIVFAYGAKIVYKNI